MVRLLDAEPAQRTVAAPGLRVHPVPPLEPPFDDERGAGVEPCPGQLEVLGVLPTPAAARDRPVTLLPVSRAATTPAVPGTRLAPPPSDRAPTAARPATRPATRSAAQPSPAAAAHLATSRFIGACVEVLNGYRPVAHLRAVTSPGEYTVLADELMVRATGIRTRRLAVRAALGVIGGSPAPPAGGGPDAGGRGRPAAVVVRRLRVFEPREGVAEAAVVLGHGDRAWAMAVRLECRQGAWLCTRLQVI